MGTYDGVLLGVKVELKVVKIEIPLMRLILGVIIGWSLRKYVEYLLGSILGAGKVSVEGKYLTW